MLNFVIKCYNFILNLFDYNRSIYQDLLNDVKVDDIEITEELKKEEQDLSKVVDKVLQKSPSRFKVRYKNGKVGWINKKDLK
jgi:D-ribose pyranose/furanose isomerase RbsD